MSPFPTIACLLLLFSLPALAAGDEWTPERLFTKGAAPLHLGRLAPDMSSPSAAECEVCHAAEAREWAGSLHKKSWTQPLFQAAYRIEPMAECRNCHQPLTADLRPSDALVVLSHDPAVDTPALAAALRSGEPYVGALGSRHTQSARRQRLAAIGVPDAACDRIHGPVGLDLGARTPEEVALAVCAEILAHRSGRDAASLRAGTGPING